MATPHSTAPGTAPATIVGRYRLLDVVGAGGMGRVWRAHDELLDRTVAVKEIDPPDGMAAADHRDAQARTVREARAAARLDHPGVVRVFDVVRTTDRSFIVMEYVPSRSLHDVVARDGPLSHRDAARIGIGVLDALRAAHAAGVVHSDIKPHNVLIADDGRIVLTDFGLATFARSRTATGSVTEVGPVLGSPYYVAPERLNSGASSVRADLWSFGATLYAAVEGRPPFARATVEESLVALTTEPPDPPDRPGPLHPVIAALLAKDPSRRPAAGQVRAALTGPAGRAVGVCEVPAPRRPGSTVRTGAAIPGPVAVAATTGTATTGTATTSPATRGVAAPAPARGGGPTRIAPTARRAAARRSAALAAALVVGAGGIALVNRDRDAPAAVPAPGTAAAPLITDPCGAASAQPLAATGEQGPYALPAGWAWHRDAAGFRLAVPSGWVRAAAGTVVCFRDPDGSRSFAVDAAAPVTPAPLRHWQDAERAALGSGALPGYQRVGMAVLPLRDGGADWEYTWMPPAGPRQHVRRLLLSIEAGRAYTLQWTTTAQEWPLHTPTGQRMFASVD